MIFNEKFYNLSFYKKLIILITLLIIFTLTLAFSYSRAVFCDLQNNIFRLHVVANSNSSEDQALKYLVRDNILNYVNTLSNGISDKAQIIMLMQQNIDNIKSIALETIYSEGYNYSVNVSIGNFEFPTKTYGDISLPSGLYDALKIEIGDAAGQNWWCVMFPPLCFIDVTSGVVPDSSKEIMQNELSNESYALISDDNTDNKIKFKLVELFQSLNIKHSKI